MRIMRIINRSIFQNRSTFSPRWLSTAATEQATAATELATDATEKATAATEQATDATEQATAETEKATAATQPRRRNVLFYQVSKANPKSKTSIADILNKWVSKGNEVKRSDLFNLNNYFRGRKNFTAALQLYNWMDSNKFEITNADQAIRIDLLYKAEGVVSAENYFNTLQVSEKTSKTYGALLSCYCRDKLFDKASKIFEEMKVLSCTSTLNYNSMASLYYNIEQPEKVINVVEEMESNNVALNIYTYNILINSYAAMKNLDAIEGVLEKMKSNNVECDLFTYGNLATIYFNSGLHEKAKDFLEIMEKMKSQPDKEVFEASRTLIKLYAEMNDSSGVNRAWESLKTAFSTPSNTSYLFMLLALSKLGDQERLETVFKEWEEGCSVYDYRLPNVLLEYYISRDMIEEASTIYEKLAKKQGEPNLRTFNLFASFCVKKCEIDLALQYLETGLEKASKTANRKWFPTDETIKLFVDYFEEKKDAERCEKFMQIMKKVNRLDSESLLLKLKGSNEVS